MPGAHETLEHAEHAGHDPSHHGVGGSSKIFGVTMALIAVLIAFCAAMVGSERNELTRAMIEQTQAHSDYTSASTKFRLIMLELEKLRPGAAAAAGTAPLDAVVERFLELYDDYSKERGLSKNWADSYHPLVEAHFEAAEGYEKAQLVSEIAIVLASLAVLLSNKPAWMISLVLAVVSVIQIGRTYLLTKHSVNETLVRIQHAEEAFTDLRKAHVGANQDEKVVEILDPGGKIRAGIEAHAKAHESGTPEKKTEP